MAQGSFSTLRILGLPDLCSLGYKLRNYKTILRGYSTKILPSIIKKIDSSN